MTAEFGALAFAGLAALGFPAVLRPILQALGVVDLPNERSSHSRVTLRGGGAAPLLGVIVGGVWVALAVPMSESLMALLVLAAGVAMGVVGLTEDVRGVRPALRAGLQALVGGALAITLCGMTGGGWIWIPLAVLFFTAHVNFTNFMDGINGISGLHGLVVGLAFSALGLLQGLDWLVFVGFIIAIVFVVFLPWNLTPPGMFLGDVGSYLLGGVVGATALAALFAGLNPVAVLAPLAVYWADTVSTLARRLARGEHIFEAHRTHAYQRLTNTGLSHCKSAAVVAAFTLLTSAVGILVQVEILAWPLGMLLILGFAVTYLSLPRLCGDVLPASRPAPLADVPLPPASEPREDWQPKRWAVLGASGFIGSAMVEHLTAEGYEVVPMKAPRLELDPAMSDGKEVAALAETLSETQVLAASFGGVDVVVNAAGLATPDARASAALYGADALLPAVVSVAAARAGVGRMLHLSSAAVQGDRAVLDTSIEVDPFSPYARAKALGERALLAVAATHAGSNIGTELVILRATSVQGPGRPTTEALQRIARSPLASVAAPGNHPSVVSSVAGLSRFVSEVGATTASPAAILLQPWEGMTVTDVLDSAGGGRSPVVLPEWFCRLMIVAGKRAGRLVPGVAGLTRRIEMMWFGQKQEDCDRDETIRSHCLVAALVNDRGTA